MCSAEGYRLVQFFVGQVHDYDWVGIYLCRSLNDIQAHAATAAPGANDDSAAGYAVGSVWIDTTNAKAYVCLDATATAAVWTEITQAGGSGGGSDISANQSVVDSTLVILSLDSEHFDTDTIHDTSTNNSRLTCKTAGKYLISGNIERTSSSTGVRQFRLWLNGTTIIGHAYEGAPSGTLMQHITVLYDLAVNDYVEMRVWQNSTVSLNVLASAQHSPEFSMVKVLG